MTPKELISKGTFLPYWSLQGPIKRVKKHGKVWSIRDLYDLWKARLFWMSSSSVEL